MIAIPIRDLVMKAVQMDITYLETFQGYKGDNVLKIVLEKSTVRDNIVRLAHKEGLDFKSDFEFDGKFKGQFNLYIAYADPEVYQLKG